MSKGEEKQIGRGSIGLLEEVLPLMPKGETVGNVVIDGKGDGKGGPPEAAKGELRSSISQGADETKRA